MRVMLCVLLLFILGLPAQAATETNRRTSLGDVTQRAPKPNSTPTEALEAVTVMEGTAATVGEDAPAAGHTRYRFNVPVDISGAPINVTMMVACRLLNQAGTRRVREWRRVGNRFRHGREYSVPVNEHLALGINDVPLRNGTYKGSVQVDIDLPPRSETPEHYICQLEYRSTGRGGLPSGTYACTLGTREDSECIDMTKGETSSMRPN
jgi:hypothetical protein